VGGQAMASESRSSWRSQGSGRGAPVARGSTGIRIRPQELRACVVSVLRNLGETARADEAANVDVGPGSAGIVEKLQAVAGERAWLEARRALRSKQDSVAHASKGHRQGRDKGRMPGPRPYSVAASKMLFPLAAVEKRLKDRHRKVAAASSIADCASSSAPSAIGQQMFAAADAVSPAMAPRPMPMDPPKLSMGSGSDEDEGDGADGAGAADGALVAGGGAYARAAAGHDMRRVRARLAAAGDSTISLRVRCVEAKCEELLAEARAAWLRAALAACARAARRGDLDSPRHCRQTTCGRVRASRRAIWRDGSAQLPECCRRP